MEEPKGREVITDFSSPNDFLSNFYMRQIKIHGITFPSSEHAFQALKSDRIDVVRQFCDPAMSCGRAKKLGRQLNLRKDWETIKVGLMYAIVRAKFTQHEDLKEMLLETANKELIEGNKWGDTTWGVCDGEGLNLLGKILMLVRSELCGIKYDTTRKAADKVAAPKAEPEPKIEKTYAAKEFILSLMKGEDNAE